MGKDVAILVKGWLPSTCSSKGRKYCLKDDWSKFSFREYIGEHKSVFCYRDASAPEGTERYSICPGLLICTSLIFLGFNMILYFTPGDEVEWIILPFFSKNIQKNECYLAFDTIELPSVTWYFLNGRSTTGSPRATPAASLFLSPHVEKKLPSIYYFKYTLQQTLYSFSTLFKYTLFILSLFFYQI